MKIRFSEVVGFVAIILLIGFVGRIETTYTMQGEIIEVNQDLITLQDSVGYTYSFYGDGFSVGDSVKAVFDTKGTDSNRFDDEIKKVKKL